MRNNCKQLYKKKKNATKKVHGLPMYDSVTIPGGFVATQAHPEFTSRFEQPNPLFAGFIVAAQLCKDKQIVSQKISEQLLSQSL